MMLVPRYPLSINGSFDPDPDPVFDINLILQNHMFKFEDLKNQVELDIERI